MRLTSILALCVAAAPVLAEQKYPAWMGNAMDFAQTTTGGEYDVDTSAPKETFYWDGAAEVAFLTPHSIAERALLQKMDYLSILNASLNDIQSEVLSEVLGYEKTLNLEIAANDDESRAKVFYSSRYPRVITTKKMNSTTVSPADLPNVNLVRGGGVETLTETDRVNGFLWFNNLTIKEGQDLTIKGKITTDDNIANRCVVKMFIAKGGMSDLKKVIRHSNKDKLPKLISQSKLGGDLRVNNFFEEGLTLPLGFLATCETGEIETFEISVANKDKKPAGLKKSAFNGKIVNANTTSADSFELEQYRIKTPIHSKPSARHTYLNWASDEPRLVYASPVQLDIWFPGLPRSSEVSAINLDYVDLKISEDYFPLSDDAKIGLIDQYNPELMFASMEFELPLKTPKQGNYELLLVQKSNISHGGPRRFPFVSISNKEERAVLFFDRALGDSFRYDLDQEYFERNVYKQGESHNEYRIGASQKVSRITLNSAEKVNLDIKVYPYFMTEIKTSRFNEYSLQNYSYTSLEKIDFPRSWLKYPDMDPMLTPEGLTMFTFGFPRRVAGVQLCSKDSPCVADEQNFIRSIKEKDAETKLGFSLYIKDPDQAYFRSITLADLGEINAVRSPKTAPPVEDAKRLADDLFN